MYLFACENEIWSLSVFYNVINQFEAVLRALSYYQIGGVYQLYKMR